MQIEYGFRGWVKIHDDDLPGVVYAGLDVVDGQPRIVQLYIDGRGEPIQAGALRRFPLAALEQWVASMADSDGSPLPLPVSHNGPNLSLLAAVGHSTNFGSYKGRHCPTCSAPIRWEASRTRDGREEAIADWTELEWLARFGKIPQPSMPKDRDAAEVKPIRLSAPEHGLTDEFLVDVARAYRAAVEQRLSPAKTLAEVAGVERRTVESWVYKARKRGLMAPAVKKGRIV